MPISVQTILQSNLPLGPTGPTGPLFNGGNITGDITVLGNLYRTGVPLVLNDIGTHFDGMTCDFALRNEQDAVTSIVDSKDLEVIVNGRRLKPYIKELRYPWMTPYDSYDGYRVRSDTLTIYNPPDIGSSGLVTIVNTSTAETTKRYPYSATTIGLGD
jgi:hypothetical protein